VVKRLTATLQGLEILKTAELPDSKKLKLFAIDSFK